MADKLSKLLQKVQIQSSSKDKDPNQRLIDALDRALKATTPERPGCPWDRIEEDNEQEKRGIWIPEAD